jgi:hypothetical protein
VAAVAVAEAVVVVAAVAEAAPADPMTLASVSHARGLAAASVPVYA